jgi:SAM-dependent methyltransferase
MNGCMVCYSNSLDPNHHPKVQDPWTRESFQIAECKECGLVQIINRPKAEELEKYYQNNAGHEMRASSKNSIYWTLRNIQLARESKIFAQAPSPIKSIIDYGCGNGQFLAHLSQQNKYDLTGIDFIPSNQWLWPDIPYIELKKHSGQKEQISLPKSDLMIMRHVVEHLLDPVSILQSAHRSDIDYLWVVVPNLESPFRKIFGSYWFTWDPPRHLMHFSESTLIKTLQKSGYEPLVIKKFGMDEIVSSFYHFLLIRYPFAKWMSWFSPKSPAAAISSALCAFVLPSSIGILAKRVP